MSVDEIRARQEAIDYFTEKRKTDPNNYGFCMCPVCDLVAPHEANDYSVNVCACVDGDEQ